MKRALDQLLGGVLAATACAALGGCASQSANSRPVANPDPFEPVNRVIYNVNDFGDRYLVKPAARAYERHTPRAFRVGANNFFDNLRYPITIINDFLQGKVGQGGRDLARFTLNTTVGLVGLFDPASEIGLARHDEDFGQTLVVWGVPEGPYLMVPIFGPYTVTSALGDLAGTQVSPLVQIPEDKARTALWIWYLIHLRYSLLAVDEEVQRAFDPYIFVRDSYLQNRRYKINDGRVSDDDLFPEDEFEDDTGENEP